MSNHLPIQYPEYKNSTQTLIFGEVEAEIRDMIQYLVKHNKGKYFDRNEVFDKSIQAQRLKLLNDLRQCPSGLCLILKETIKYGVAYHHSGLTTEEREVVERGYRTGALLVLVATSTLSTGINLPAKVVFFKQPLIAISLMDAAKYKQMSGRAGRTGFDTKGDSIMICNNMQKEYVLVIISQGNYYRT